MAQKDEPEIVEVPIEEFNRMFHAASRTSDGKLAMQTAHVSIPMLLMLQLARPAEFEHIYFAIHDWFRDVMAPDFPSTHVPCGCCGEAKVQPPPAIETGPFSFVCLIPCGRGEPEPQLTIAIPICRECSDQPPEQIINGVGNKIGKGDYEKFASIDAAKAAGKGFRKEIKV